MASEVAIVNAALIKIGEATIVSLSDASKPARLGNAIYGDIRDAVLQAHPWNFALARASLAANVIAPAWGFTYAYDFPSTPDYCLRVLSIESDGIQGVVWKTEGRQIVTDEGAPLNILYIKQVTDPALFTPLFRECLAARLAAELAEPLKQSGPMKEMMEQLYVRKIQEARTADAQEGTPDDITADEWLTARMTSTGFSTA